MNWSLAHFLVLFEIAHPPQGREPIIVPQILPQRKRTDQGSSHGVITPEEERETAPLRGATAFVAVPARSGVP